MKDHFDLIIPGAAPSGKTIAVTAPYDGASIATVGTADADAVERALKNAEALFRDRDGWLSAADRIAVLERAADLLRERAEAFALAAAREGGKPLMDSRIETTRAIESLQGCAEALRGDGGDVIPMGQNAASRNKLAFTRREPVGVVVAVSAFNHPLNLIAHQVGPAIAVGCPVIVKPAEDTPLTCFRLVELLMEAGIPEGWCQALVVDDLDIATGLVTDPRVGFFSFIGSARVGWMLRGKLAPGTRCALEHGGVAPVIVAADADIDTMLPKLAKGGFYHAGQVCVSVQRVFAHESIARDLAARLAKAARALKVGDPTSADTEVGPLIRHREVDRVASWVQAAVDGGAELLTGGERISNACYQPTVLYAPGTDAEVSRQEVFGPVVCVYPYADMDEAIARANDVPFAFQAAVFTGDIDTAMRSVSRLDASAVMINEQTAFRVDWMPFAGLRQSGLGVGGIPHTMRDMQIEKLVVLHSPEI